MNHKARVCFGFILRLVWAILRHPGTFDLTSVPIVHRQIETRERRLPILPTRFIEQWCRRRCWYGCWLFIEIIACVSSCWSIQSFPHPSLDRNPMQVGFGGRHSTSCESNTIAWRYFVTRSLKSVLLQFLNNFPQYRYLEDTRTEVCLNQCIGYWRNKIQLDWDLHFEAKRGLWRWVNLEEEIEDRYLFWNSVHWILVRHCRTSETRESDPSTCQIDPYPSQFQDESSRRWHWKLRKKKKKIHSTAWKSWYL